MYNLRDFQKAFILPNISPTLTQTYGFIHFLKSFMNWLPNMGLVWIVELKIWPKNLQFLVLGKEKNSLNS